MSSFKRDGVITSTFIYWIFLNSEQSKVNTYTTTFTPSQHVVEEEIDRKFSNAWQAPISDLIPNKKKDASKLQLNENGRKHFLESGKQIESKQQKRLSNNTSYKLSLRTDIFE